MQHSNKFITKSHQWEKKEKSKNFIFKELQPLVSRDGSLTWMEPFQQVDTTLTPQWNHCINIQHMLTDGLPSLGRVLLLKRQMEGFCLSVKLPPANKPTIRAARVQEKIPKNLINAAPKCNGGTLAGPGRSLWTVRRNHKRMIRSKSPFSLFVWLSPYISVSIHLLPLFFNACPSLSITLCSSVPLSPARSLWVTATELQSAVFWGGSEWCVRMTGKKRQSNNIISASDMIWDAGQFLAAGLQWRTEGTLRTFSGILWNVKPREQTDWSASSRPQLPRRLPRSMVLFVAAACAWASVDYTPQYQITLLPWSSTGKLIYIFFSRCRNWPERSGCAGIRLVFWKHQELVH